MQITRIIKQIGLVLLKDKVYLLDNVIMSSFLNIILHNLFLLLFTFLTLFTSLLLFTFFVVVYIFVVVYLFVVADDGGVVGTP